MNVELIGTSGIFMSTRNSEYWNIGILECYNIVIVPVAFGAPNIILNFVDRRTEGYRICGRFILHFC